MTKRELINLLEIVSDDATINIGSNKLVAVQFLVEKVVISGQLDIVQEHVILK